MDVILVKHLGLGYLDSHPQTVYILKLLARQATAVQIMVLYTSISYTNLQSWVLYVY